MSVQKKTFEKTKKKSRSSCRLQARIFRVWKMFLKKFISWLIMKINNFYFLLEGTPINRLPIMAKSVLDLYELYKLVIGRGGLVNVINKKLWQEIIKDLNLPSSITSAAFTLRTQYTKYLYPYECEKYNLSSDAELQAAIENNKRDGSRRSTSSSYNQFSPQSPQTHHQQLQLVSWQQPVDSLT